MPRSASRPLTRERIVDTAMQLVEDGAVLSFRRLGAALGTEHTAIYRHYSTKDELVRAMVDRVAELVHEGWMPSGDWKDDFRDSARRLRDFYRQRPHLAALTGMRTARGEHEFAVVEHLLGLLTSAGLEGETLARTYRATVVVWMTYAVGESARAALDDKTRQTDRDAWEIDYLRLPDDQYPMLASVRGLIPSPDDPSTYDDILELLIAGIENIAGR